ncbi:DUF3298 and DUF4163 domain-containing protein [Gillisia sp. CAL575]|uniref:DUF3298 and DUF4163 domain-containing protein n=1 Tax=Gillisia sp. CAL575 TaxID=985255 RepID=UPI0003A7399E|nr:DUF3298 and DUF4163 domain-containing protein [Gillisia sp. CAL575]
MKILITLIFCISLISCKKETSNQLETDSLEISKDSITVNKDSIIVLEENEFKKEQSINIKRASILNKKDDKAELKELVLSRSFIKDEECYLITYKYPYLNENIKESYANFNSYLENDYLDIKGVEKAILEEENMNCDPTLTVDNRSQKKVDYKIFSLDDKLISVLFYNENFYSGTLHPSYSFDCLNFDLTHSKFMKYEDFFNTGSEEELRDILNEVLSNKIKSGDVYYDCWEISADDFYSSKDNFVINNLSVEYYFADCVICPSYTGTFSVSIPLEFLKPVLKQHNSNPLL